MRDPTRDEMVAATLAGTLDVVRFWEDPDSVDHAREFLASGVSYKAHYSPGTEVYSFLASPDNDADPYAWEREYHVMIHVMNNEPPVAVCRLLLGDDEWVQQRRDLGPFYFKANGRIVQVVLEGRSGRALAR